MTAPSALFASTTTVSPLISPIPNLVEHDSFLNALEEEKAYMTGDEKSETEEHGRAEDITDSPKRIKINKNLLIYKAFYFLFYGAVGSLFPYLAVFYKQLYLSAQQVGFLIGIRPFIQMCAGPLWGALADTYNVKKIILLMSLAAWLGTNYSISIVRIPPETACSRNFSIIRIPEMGKITENRKLPSHTSKEIKNATSKQLLPIYKQFRSKPSPLKKNVTNVLKTLKSGLRALIGPRIARDTDYITSARDEGWSYANTSEQLLPLQRILAADELEEEFDSLNTDDEYPWPIGNKRILNNRRQHLPKSSVQR